MADSTRRADHRSGFFRAEIVERPLAKMRAQRMAFIDALVLNLAERTPNVEGFVI